MAISKEMFIGEILDAHPETAATFMEMGMHCLHCPSARGETLAEACMVHGLDADEMLKKLEAMIG